MPTNQNQLGNHNTLLIEPNINEEPNRRWLCCQIGAREHYALPRALYGANKLEALITDAWVRPRAATFVLGDHPRGGLRERFHPDLTDAPVLAFTQALMKFELSARLRRINGWRLMTERNRWFQKRVLSSIDSFHLQHLKSRRHLTVFSYSYAAADLFRYAKSRGWHTVLGQIDPGPVEEEIVRKEHTRIPGYESDWLPAPSEYWQSWREECELADRIVVNSTWSRNGVQASGIDAKKISEVPLAYEPPSDALQFVRTYPCTFSRKRPLRVLFLGQVIIRKGIVPLLEAAKLLRDEPIEFWLVGPVGVATTNGAFGKNVHLTGSVSRSVASRYYQRADVFVFPTFSDGFGLTQLEAQAWKLPIIASRFCGNVVRHEEVGLLLEAVTPKAIANALLSCLNNPSQLQAFSNRAFQSWPQGWTNLEKSLDSLTHAF